MAALSDTQLAVLHVALGTAADEDEMQDRYDRLGDVDLVIQETLEQRLADLLATPAQFAVPGEYSQGTEANIKALQQQLAGLGAGNSYPVRVVGPPTRPRR